MSQELNGTFELTLRAPAGDVPFGTFTVENGRVAGTGRHNITYRGTCRSTGSGVYVKVRATVPHRTPIGNGLYTQGESTRDLEFHLRPEHLSGNRTTSLWLHGFGMADVSFEPRS